MSGWPSGKAVVCKTTIGGSNPPPLSKGKERKMPLEKKGYDPASPIQVINGLVTTERSGIGKWGAQSHEGFLEYCRIMSRLTPENSIVAEVGCYAGESTLVFSHCFGRVFAIDPWENGYDDDDLCSHAIPMGLVEASFDKRMQYSTNMKKLKMTSEEAAAGMDDGCLDLVYVDAIHKIGDARDDYLRWIKKIRKGGYIGGHDFCGFWGEVVDAVLEAVGLPDIRTKDGSWAKQIK